MKYCLCGRISVSPSHSTLIIKFLISIFLATRSYATDTKLLFSGEQKLHFVPNMVSQILEVTLVPETELRKATLPIFFDMMKCEQKATGSFRQVRSSVSIQP